MSTAPHVVTKSFPLNIAGTQLTVHVTVDLLEIAKTLGPKAAHNKSRKSKLQVGVTCQVTA